MKKSLARKPARAMRKPRFKVSAYVQARMDKSMSSTGNFADKRARKDDMLQREACAAVAETLDAWIDWLKDTAPGRTEGDVERAQGQINQWKAKEKVAMTESVTGTNTEADYRTSS